MHKVLIICLICCVFLGDAHGAEKNTVKACGHHDYPPWNWQQDGKIVGVCAEATQYIFNKLGKQVDLSYVGPWKRCQEEVRNGNIDVNICALMNNNRQKYSTYAPTPIGMNPISVFVAKDNVFEFSHWKDLISKRAALVAGVSLGEEFDQFLSSHVDPIRVDEQYQTYLMLLLGRIDFIPTGYQLGSLQTKILGISDQVIALPHPIQTANVYISVSNKSEVVSLIDDIDGVIQTSEFSTKIAQWLIEQEQAYRYNFKHEKQQLFSRFRIDNANREVSPPPM